MSCVQVLGLMELALANPFASLRMHGGSNHLIMPTGLLQLYAGNGAVVPSGGGGGGGGGSMGQLAGGVVRVEA